MAHFCFVHLDSERAPDYEVSERVRRLNAELANEPPVSSDEKRAQTTVKFKEDLVDFISSTPDPIPSSPELAGTPTQEESSNIGNGKKVLFILFKSFICTYL